MFDREGVWWAPVQATHDLVHDDQAVAAGCFVDVATADGGTVRTVSTPIDFGTTRWAPGGPSPEMAQHTEEVLLELGYDWDTITELKDAGAVS